MSEPKCPYCDAGAVLHRSSAKFYHGRDYGPVWACVPCGAWVGCHDGTEKPLGRLANKELRQAKIMAHAAFDPLWKPRADGSRPMNRRDAYRWLAGRLGIPAKRCHIGWFDAEMCQRVVDVCAEERSA
jgi:hypothetical protein